MLILILSFISIFSKSNYYLTPLIKTSAVNSSFVVYLGDGFKNPGMYEVSGTFTFSDILSHYDNYYGKGYTSSLSLTSTLYPSQKIILTKVTLNSASSSQSDVVAKSLLGCSKQDFLKASGVGDKTADLIINYITQNPNITSSSDLLNIKGIGQKTVDEISKYCY